MRKGYLIVEMMVVIFIMAIVMVTLEMHNIEAALLKQRSDEASAQLQTTILAMIMVSFSMQFRKMAPLPVFWERVFWLEAIR